MGLTVHIVNPNILSLLTRTKPIQEPMNCPFVYF